MATQQPVAEGTEFRAGFYCQTAEIPCVEALGAMAALQEEALPIGCGAMAALRSACEERHQASPAEAIENVQNAKLLVGFGLEVSHVDGEF